MRRSLRALYVWLYLVMLVQGGLMLGYNIDSPDEAHIERPEVEDLPDNTYDTLMDGVLEGSFWAVETLAVPFHYMSLYVPFELAAAGFLAFAFTPLWVVLWGIYTGRVELTSSIVLNRGGRD